MAFECGICTSMFNAATRQPLILECGHTFCRECIQHNLGPQRWCPYCRQPIQKHVDDLTRNYALENAMEAANVPLMDLMDRWGLANAERMMVKPDQLQLVSLISRKGNSGEVWRGSLWGKPVAIKLLPLVGVDERQLDCLRREVAVLLHTTGECKQVCIYKGFCVKGGNFAIIMKLYSHSLAARVARHPGRRLPLPLALKYSTDIAKGLVELHRLGVIAADLKPDNVLIDDELGDAVIADFGISSVVTCSIGVSAAAASRGGRRGREATRSSAVLRGTPNYMAPEQFTPGDHPTNKVDIWGFAATLLHMLTGSPPWANDTLLQICTAVGVAKQRPPLPEGLPHQLHTLIRCCFEPDPARRPTAVHILKGLQAMAPVLERPQLLRTTQHLARSSHLLAAARGVLAGLQQDCSQLVQQLAAEEAAATAVRAGQTRLRPVAEEGDGQQQVEGSVADGAASSSSGRSSKDEQQVALDQYLQQIGLLSLISQESSLGMPSAPPLPASSSSSTTVAAAAAASGSKHLGKDSGHCGVGNDMSSRKSSTLGSRSQNNKLPRVLWSEEEALQEEHEEQQWRREQQQQQCAAASMGFTSPRRQPQHTRSASEQVMGHGGAGTWWANQMHQSNTQQQQQQQRPPLLLVADQHQQLITTAAGLPDAISPKQHHRSASEGCEVWGAKPHGDSMQHCSRSSGISSSSRVGKQLPGQLPTHFESPAHSTSISDCAAEPEHINRKLGMGDMQQQQQQQECGGSDCNADSFAVVKCAEASPGKQRKQWQIPADRDEGCQHQQPLGCQQQQQQSKPWTKDDQVKQRAQQQIAALFGQNKWPGSSSKSSSSDCSATGLHAADSSGVLGGPLMAGASAHRAHAAASSDNLAYAPSEQHHTGSSVCPVGSGVCRSPAKAQPRRHQRTLSNMLLGRGSGLRGSAGSSPDASNDTASSARDSPDRMQQSCGRQHRSGSSILAAGAAAGVAGAAAGVAGAAAGVASAAGRTAATAAGVVSAACLVGATVPAAAGVATAAVVSGAAVEAVKVVAPGVVAALASRFSVGGSNRSSTGAMAQQAAAVPIPQSPSKASKWRSLFGGSPARKRPQTPLTTKAPVVSFAAAAAAAHSAGAKHSSCSSSDHEIEAYTSSAVSPGRGGRGACSSSNNSPVPDRQQQQQQQQVLCGASTSPREVLLGSVQQQRHGSHSHQGGVLGAYAAVPPAAGSPKPKLCGSLLSQQQEQSGGAEYDSSSTSTAVPAVQVQPISSSINSCTSKSPSPGRPRPCSVTATAAGSTGCSSHNIEKAALASPSTAAVAVAAAIASAAQPDGSCSPLKTHVRKLSLPAKLQGLSAAVQEQQHDGAAAAAATDKGSPSPRGQHHRQNNQQQQRQQQQQQQQQHTDHTAQGECAAGRQMAAVTSGTAVQGLGNITMPQQPPSAAAAAARQPQASNCISVPAGGSSGGGSGGGSGSSSHSGGGSHSQLLAEATQLECLARQLSLSGRREEAEAALRSALAILTQQLGAAHPTSIAAMTRLALCLNKNGKASEAEGLFRQVLNHKQAMLGRKHPQVGSAANNLAACLYGQGRYAAAAKMYAAALDVRKASLGEQHADTAASMSNLALCKHRLGQHAEAEAWYHQALLVRTSALGQVHPDVAATAHQLGHCLSQQGRHSEALVFHKQGLYVRQQLQHNTGDAMQQQQQPGDREGFHGGASAGGGTSRNNAEDVVTSHRSVGLCLMQLGCDVQAQEHFIHVLEAKTAEVLELNPPLPPGHDSPAGAVGTDMAVAHAGRHSRHTSFAAAAGLQGLGGSSLGVADDGVDWSVLEEGDSRLTKQQQDALLAMAAAAEDLGRCYSRQGKHSDAEELYWQALEARSQVLGARHELVQATEEQLRDCLDRQC